MDEVTTSLATVWATRWALSHAPGFSGRYCVTMGVEGFYANFPAIVDDFGNLVRVW